MTTERGAIGVSRPRPDGPPKVRGAIRYGADRQIAGLLHARLVLATPAHARIVSIDRTAALAVPGVALVLVAADLPIATTDPDRMAVPLAGAEVVFAGQPVAMVVAASEAAAADAAELVDVRYELLPAVVDVIAAMAPGAPLARHIESESSGGPSMDAQTHAAVGAAGDMSIEAEVLSGNVKGRHRYRAGDAAAALAGAAAVATGRFTTSWVHQGYLEPSVSTARLDDDGGLVVETATQSIFGVRNDLARVLGLPHHRIRVVGTPLGGAFGGKWSLFESLVAAATLALRRPVRLVLDRSTDLRITNPGQGFDLELRIGADAEGHFVGLEARIVADSGAFEDTAFEGLAGVLIAGPYAWPAFDIRAYGVRTNRFGVGPYRAPTAPPMCFALESLVDELAERLGLDSLDVRDRNAAPAGSPMVDGEPWPATGVREVIAALRAVPAWRSRDDSGRPDEGTGVALAYWPGSTDPASAVCRVSPDGSVQVVTGVVDMSGVAGGFQAIAAEVLGLDPTLVTSVSVDTGSAPPSPGSGGSTITYSAGRAVRAAAEDARLRLLEAAALQLEIDPADLELVDGTVRPRGTPERAIPIAKVVRANQRAGRRPIEGHANTEQLSLAPSVAGHVARVRVDRETGEVAVLSDHVVQDVGRALNPALVTDQQHGAAAQGIGWALRERLVHDAGGQLASGTFLDYALPRVEDVGTLSNTIVEVPAADGPFGAKGIGEAPVIAGAAAIGNAIAAATGLRMRELPMSAPAVLRALADS